MTILNQSTLQELKKDENPVITGDPELSPDFSEEFFFSELTKLLCEGIAAKKIVLEQVTPYYLWRYLEVFAKFPDIELETKYLPELCKRVIFAFYNRGMEQSQRSQIMPLISSCWQPLVQPLVELAKWASGVEQIVFQVRQSREFTHEDIPEPPAAILLPNKPVSPEIRLPTFSEISKSPIQTDSPSERQEDESMSLLLPIEISESAQISVTSAALVSVGAGNVAESPGQELQLPPDPFVPSLDLPPPREQKKDGSMSLPLRIKIPKSARILLTSAALASVGAENSENSGNSENSENTKTPQRKNRVVAKSPGPVSIYSEWSQCAYTSPAKDTLIVKGHPVLTKEQLSNFSGNNNLEHLVLDRVTAEFLDVLFAHLSLGSCHKLTLTSLSDAAINYLRAEINWGILPIRHLVLSQYDVGTLLFVYAFLPNKNIHTLTLHSLTITSVRQLTADTFLGLDRLILENISDTALLNIYSLLSRCKKIPHIECGDGISGEYKKWFNALNGDHADEDVSLLLQGAIDSSRLLLEPMVDVQTVDLYEDGIAIAGDELSLLIKGYEGEKERVDGNIEYLKAKLRDHEAIEVLHLDGINARYLQKLGTAISAIDGGVKALSFINCAPFSAIDRFPRSRETMMCFDAVRVSKAGIPCEKMIGITSVMLRNQPLNLNIS